MFLIFAAVSPTTVLSAPNIVIIFSSTLKVIPGRAFTITGCEKPTERVRLSEAACALYPTPVSSSFFSKPSVTPITKLASVALVKPSIGFKSLSLLLALTIIFPSSIAAITPFGILKERLPLGPATVIVEPVVVIITPSLMIIGFFAIFDIFTKLRKEFRHLFLSFLHLRKSLFLCSLILLLFFCLVFLFHLFF